MTRLLRGLTSLTSVCLLTLVVGCGGSDGKKATKCDGGACSDAKGDAIKVDGKLDAKTPDGGATVEVGKFDTAVLTPDALIGTSDTPIAPTDTPIATTDTGIVTPDTAPQSDTTPVPPDTNRADVRADVTPDTKTDGTVLADTRPDTTVIISGDTGTDTPVTTPDAGVDASVVVTDAEADVSDDATEEEVAVAIDATVDAPSVESGDAGCTGALCDNFQNDNPDAGLPSTLTVVGTGAGDTWVVVADGTNNILQQTDSTVASTYVVTGNSSWTNQTIEVQAEFLPAIDGSSEVRVCGRFDAATQSGYCLYVTSGATSGTMRLYKRTGSSGTPQLAETIELAIPVSTWHLYRLVISNTSATSVTVSAYLDDAATPTVTGVDNSTILSAGAVALGTSNVSANFDELFVTTP